MARPKKSEDDKSVMIGLEKKYIDMIDEKIENEMIFRNYKQGSKELLPTSHQIASARRAFLGRLIESQLGFEANFPVSIEISVPISANLLSGFDEVNEWVQREQERLEKEAPEIIKYCLENNRKVHRLKKDAKKSDRVSGA